MGGFEILVMLIGVAVGAGAVYWWQERRINRLEKDHKRALRKMSAERNYAERNYTPPQLNTQVNTQVNMQAVAPLESQDLPPTIMQFATSAIATSPEVAVPVEQTTEPLLATAQLQELSEQTTEAQSLLTQIFEETSFEINQPVVSKLISSPIATTPLVTTQSDKITTKIVAWGQLTNPKYIPQLLEYAKHPDASVREQVATGLGQIAAANAISAHTPQVIPVLERLSRDRHLETRYQAIIALGQIGSDQVIPILTPALRDPSTKLVKAASSALAKLKQHSTAEPKPQELPKKVVYKKPLR
jgi:HEAT repeat protein